MNDLSDEHLMLALSVGPAVLDDPLRWCREVRELASAVDAGPKTAAEAERLMETGQRLGREAAATHQSV